MTVSSSILFLRSEDFYLLFIQENQMLENIRNQREVELQNIVQGEDIMRTYSENERNRINRLESENRRIVKENKRIANENKVLREIVKKLMGKLDPTVLEIMIAIVGGIMTVLGFVSLIVSWPLWTTILLIVVGVLLILAVAFNLYRSKVSIKKMERQNQETME